MALIDNYLKKKDSSNIVTNQQSGLLIDKYVTKKETPAVKQQVPQKKSFVDKLKGFGSGILKFGARVGVETGNLATSAFDFATDFLSGQIKKNIEKPFIGISEVTKPIETQKKLADQWKSFYSKTGGEATEKVKSFTQNLRNIDYIKPSDEWTNSSTKEKFTTRLPETILNIGPGIISSLGLYAINPAVGLAASSGSTADEIKTIAVESGADEDRAEILGLGTGLLVGWLDKIVPDEVFSSQQKSSFTKNFAKKVFLTGIKEAGTEVLQEDVQMLAEATVREKITKDEFVIRNLMAGLGGLIGGVGADTVVSFINGVRSGEIAPQTESQVETTKQTESVQVGQTPKDKVVADSGQTFVSQPSVDKKIKTVQTEEVDREQLQNTEAIKSTKQTLKKVQKELAGAVTEAEGMSLVAQEKRSGVNIENVNKLKRIYAKSKKFQEGDIETIRASKTGELLNKVIENIQEVYPEMSEQEAFDFAINLPTKAQEKLSNKQIIDLKKKEKSLQKYLDQLNIKQEELIIRKENEMSKEWQQALDTQENLVRKVQVPSKELPVGSGKEKVSRLEARVKGVLNKATQEDIDSLGLSKYRQMNEEDQITMAANYVKENPEEALRVAMGEQDPPKGLLQNSVYVALVEAGREDTDLATKVATLRATRAGQEIDILKKIMADNPVVIMQEVVNARIEAYEDKKRVKVSEVIKNDKKSINENIKKPDKYDWNTFIESIKC